MLGRLRKELIKEGFSPQNAEQLALDWGRSIASAGGPLTVKEEA